MKDAIMETAYGKVRGTTEDGVYSFKGIPYGGPTDGPKRFMPPVPPEPWSGIRDATRYGQSCWQPSFGLIRPDIHGGGGIDAMGEDCLVLNVWTRGLNDNRKRPVMVWLHGGGFITGSGNELPYYSGASLARTYDVVVVSVNHRLGVYGYLHLGELCGEKYASSGNAGILDLVAAFEWVRDNIATFGGDPGNVMIFGESGGGAKVSLLMAMPTAKGLFHRAVVQSGPGLRMLTLEEATRNARGFLELVRVNPERIDALHKFRTDVLNNAWLEYTKGGAIAGGEQTTPVVDGKIIPTHPFDPVAAPTASHVPLIIGSNKDEMTLFLSIDQRNGQSLEYDEETMRKTIMGRIRRWVDRKAMTAKLENLIATYRQTRPGATPNELLIAITSDQTRVSSIRLAERKSAGGTAPVYMYLFTWESPVSRGRLKSAHTFEIPFVFNNVDPSIRLVGNAPERLTLAANMSKAWVAFTRSGNPNHEGTPHWPTYTTEKRATMIFDTECRVENDPQSKERKAWDEII